MFIQDEVLSSEGTHLIVSVNRARGSNWLGLVWFEAYPVFQFVFTQCDRDSYRKPFWSLSREEGYEARDFNGMQPILLPSQIERWTVLTCLKKGCIRILGAPLETSSHGGFLWTGMWIPSLCNSWKSCLRRAGDTWLGTLLSS